MKRKGIKVSLVITCLLFWITSCGPLPGVYVRKTKPFAPITQKPAPKMVNEKKLTVTANVVNIRKGPGSKFTIVAHARKGVVLEQLDKSDGWFKVRLPDGKIGWIYSKLVK